MVEQVRATLASAGIDCVVKHRDLRPLAGPVPFVECWPEVWVLDEAQADEAEALVRDTTTAPSSSGDTWTCGQCGQLLERQFTSCWNCEGRIATAVERADRRRLRAAYPRLLFWLIFAAMAAGAFAVLESQHGAWP